MKQHKVIPATDYDIELHDMCYVLINLETNQVVEMNGKPHLFGSEKAAIGFAQTNLGDK